MTVFQKIVRLSVFIITMQTSNYFADDNYDMWPVSEYDSNIPTHSQVLGYSVGERITSHGDMLRFFEAMEKAAPQHIKIFEYGRTWEGRKLIYVAVGNEQNIADLEGFAENMHKLADPRKTTKASAQKLIGKIASSVWLEYGVHGNEISSTDAAMMTAYHLLAATAETTNKKILKNTIVFIDPMQNPDGRARFLHHYYGSVGLEHSADRISVEHNEPWPRGRSNHYLFDMNRDWLAITQPETAGRIKMLNHYKPLVVIDLHEMGGDQSYFFAPSAKPFNPHMTQTQIDNMSAIGKNHGKHFDRYGFDYFTREVFDAFYPGYGDSWPTFYGASASTYEVGSSRGEVFQKNTAVKLTYKDTIHKHFVASISTAEAVADNHKKLLNDFYDYQVSALSKGKANKARVFIINDKNDRAGSHRLATLMAQHGVEVQQAEKDFKACGEKYLAGTYFIDTAQPRGRFVTTTFTKQVDMSKDFLKEQERRRKRKLDDEIYDVTGWSLPLMFNIKTDSCGKAIKVASHQINKDHSLNGKVTNKDATVAFLVSWGDMAAGQFLTAALRQGLVVKSADKAFVLNEKSRYKAGTLILETKSNPDNLSTIVESIAMQTGAQVDGVNTSWVTGGPSFGSDNTVTMVAPKIAMAWDSPVSSLSAGHTRFVIERQFNYPVTAIRASSIGTANLNNYHVLILPAGNYKKVLNKSAANNLKKWVKQGGVLITLGNATRFAADKEIGLLDIKRERAYKDDSEAKDESDSEQSTVEGQLFKEKKDLVNASENNKESPDFIAGVLANIEVDQEHWLTAGVNKNVVGMVYGDDIFSPIKLASGKNLAWFSGEENVLASGYLWEENKKQLAYKPYLIHQPMGNGSIVSFTQSPTTRAYLDGLNIMLMNSIFRAAAHATPLR